MRPRCCFLYLTFFGIIMAVCPQFLFVLARLRRLIRLGLSWLGLSWLGLGGLLFLTRFLLPARLLRRHQRRQNRRRRTLCRTRQIARRLLHCRTGGRRRRRLHRRSTTTIATIPAVAPVTALAAIPPRLPPRLGLGKQTAPLGEIQNFALVQPGLDADHAVRRVGLGKSVVDIRAQGVQRQLTLQVPLGARDFRAV